MQNHKRVEQQTPAPVFSLSKQDQAQLTDLIEEYQAKFTIQPHPLQSKLIAFHLWQYESQEGIFETAMLLPCIMAELACNMSTEQDAEHRETLSQYNLILKNLHTFFLTFLDNKTLYY